MTDEEREVAEGRINWTTDLDVNLRSAFLCYHAAIPHMRGAGGGTTPPTYGRPHSGGRP